MNPRATIIVPTGDDMSDETTKTVLEQNFINANDRRAHAAQRLADTNDNVSEQTKLMFLGEQTRVGTREAAAMQRMDSDKLAASILQQRAATDQPGS